MFKKLLIVLILTGLATACHKNNEEPTIGFGPNNGFTSFDGTNLPTGQTDPTDWTSDSDWNDTERQLFASLNLSLTGPQLPAKTWEISCYPNPSSLMYGGPTGIMRFTGSTPPAATVRLCTILVDSHYKALANNDFDVSKGGIAFRYMLDASKFSANVLYRIYYVLYTPGQQVYYRGHGDIKLVD